MVETAVHRFRSRGASRADASGATLKYSADGKYLFRCEADQIHVLSAKNGQRLHECVRADAVRAAQQAEAAKKKEDAQEDDEKEAKPVEVEDESKLYSDVTALALHPHNALQLLAAYADGKVLTWDFCDEKILQTVDAKVPILWMQSSTTCPSSLIMVVAGHVATQNPRKVELLKNEETQENAAATTTEVKTPTTLWSLIEFNLKKKRRGRSLVEQGKVAFTSASMHSYTEPTEVAGFAGDYVVVAAGDRVFTVRLDKPKDVNNKQLRAFTIERIAHLRDVTCVAVSAKEPEFSLGDSIGQIYRYHGPKQQLSNAKMHWHSHAVHCLNYSSDGKYLMSGGEECVLVSWHLESGRRAYLPRLSASLSLIATRAEGAGYAVALEDHMLFQYNHITKEEEWHSLGLARSGESAQHTLPSRQLVFDPVTQSLPLNGLSSAGVLQFYDAYKDRVLQSLALTERNQVTRTEDEEIPQSIAQQIGFSPSGQELVTLQQIGKNITGDEQTLRFWSRRADGTFFVNTAIDAPHGSAHVTSLACSPSSNRFSVITGDDKGEFKVWKQQQQGDMVIWLCQSVVQFREEAITSIAFSDDGSLVAVAYNHLLTLWDIGTNALRHVISSADGARIEQVLFTGKTSPFLVLRTASQVQVWHLLNFALWWRYEVPEGQSTLVSANARKQQFVVCLKTESEDAKQNKSLVVVFQPSSPVPVQMHVLTLAEQQVWSVQYHPKTGDLLVLDDKSAMWHVGALSSEALRRKHEAQQIATPSAYDAIYKRAVESSTSKKQQKHKSSKAAVAAPTSADSSALFEAPAHVLPSMTALYRSFMDTMLSKSTVTADEDKEATDAATPAASQKKKNKKRKNKQSYNDYAETPVQEQEDSVEDKQKRLKRLVDNELANTALQQQTYSTLVDAFRKKKQTNGRKSKANGSS